MYSKYHEIEAIVEDIVDNVIMALELLITKMEEIDEDVFNNFFDN